MHEMPITNFVTPLEQYALVSEEATIRDAVLALEESHFKFKRGFRYKHRAVLVHDSQNNIIGKLNEWDFLKSLELTNREIGNSESLSRFGLASYFLKPEFNAYHRWHNPLERICEKAGSILVTDVMRPMTSEEHIDEGLLLHEAVHKLIKTEKKLLIVTTEGKATGVLRLTDVFIEVCLMIKACELTDSERKQ